MNIEWGSFIVQMAIVIAVVNYIKVISKDKLGFYAILVAIGIGVIVTVLGVLPAQIDLLFVIKNSLALGLGASGIYKVAGKIGNK